MAYNIEFYINLYIIQLTEDNEEDSSGSDLRKVRYVCVTRIDITGHQLNSEGMGAWEETYIVQGIQ